MHPEFEVHILNTTGISKAESIAEIFNNALCDLLLIVPPGRELAIVRTKLEEAAFFAKKGMAKDTVNQGVSPYVGPGK